MPKLIIHQQRFWNWAIEEFKIVNADNAAERITELDVLAETIVVDGTQHAIPRQCYQTWDEMEEKSEPTGATL